MNPAPLHLGANTVYGTTNTDAGVGIGIFDRKIIIHGKRAIN